MATHWKRQHSQLTDVLPDNLHQYHLNTDQYTTLTQGREATHLHYHVQRPGWVPVVFDGTQVVCEGVKQAYSYGFPCRGFGSTINPKAPLEIRPGTIPSISHGALYDGWNAVWARGSRLLFGVVFRVNQWNAVDSFLAGEHLDPSNPMDYASYGVDLTAITNNKPFAFFFGHGVHHVSRVRSAVSLGGATAVEFYDPLPAVPTNIGQWVYLSPVDLQDQDFLTASYVLSLWWEGGRFGTAHARTLGSGLYTWEQDFYYNSSSDTWVDPKLVDVVPPTAVAVDLAVLSTRYTVAVGVYRTYRDEDSIIKSLAFYRSSTRLPDGSLRACGVLPDAELIYDDLSTPHLYLWSTRRATLRIVKIREF